MKLAERAGKTLPEFYALPDAEDRIAAWEIEQERCKFHGGPYSECPDAEADWFPQMSVCQPTMQLEAARRRFAALHEERPYHDGTFTSWEKKQEIPGHPFHFSDGVSIWLSREDLTPDDDFLGNRPPSPPQKPPEDERDAD